MEALQRKEGRYGVNEFEKNVYKQAEFIRNLKWESIPDEARERISWVVLDSVGCILKGLEEKTIFSDPDDAILQLTMAMVSTELYEGNRKAVGHPACHILPYLLVEYRERTMEEFYTAFAAAYEVAARWGSAVRFPDHVLGHGTVMATGVAAAAAILHGLSERETYELLLLSASLPEVSVWQSVYDGSGLHDIYAGLSAIVTRHMLPLMKQGVKSSGNIVENVYRDIMGAVIYPENLVKGLGEEYLICSNYFKVHTGCRFIHPFADALREELQQGLDKEQITRIDVFTYKKAAQIKDETVPNELAAKFSMPVSLAVILEKGELSPDSIRECQRDPDIGRWSGKIHLHEDEKYNRLLPETRGGRMEIYMRDGRMLTRETFHARGDFDHPKKYTKKELSEKFKRNINARAEGQDGEALEKQILDGFKTEMLQNAMKEFYEKVGQKKDE